MLKWSPEWLRACKLQDMALDIPDAAHMLSLFLGRVIVDEVSAAATSGMLCACIFTWT